ncbi:MAG: hypothetical protein ACRDPT_15905 [Streptomycetales bacterium]
MSTWLWVLVALVVIGVHLSWTAGRIDRLHTRIDASRAALDAQLVRRASIALELAISGLLDPAASVLLAGAAHEAREASQEERELAESDLSKALRAALREPVQVKALGSDPGGAQLLAELDAAMRRVPMARRFHNDVVRGTRALRRQRVVRFLRLAGRAPMPPTFEMDDAPPPGLIRDEKLL